jgi:hypothetical protein
MDKPIEKLGIDLLDVLVGAYADHGYANIVRILVESGIEVNEDKKPCRPRIGWRAVTESEMDECGHPNHDDGEACTVRVANMGGLNRICKMYGRMLIDGKYWVWDYVRDEAVPEAEMTEEQLRASELERVKIIKAGLDQFKRENNGKA